MVVLMRCISLLCQVPAEFVNWMESFSMLKKTQNTYILALRHLQTALKRVRGSWLSL
jgi:hypothetical protein